jgi:hypothetical protein
LLSGTRVSRTGREPRVLPQNGGPTHRKIIVKKTSFFLPPGKNILNCENAVEIKVIGQLALWNDEFQING